MNQSESLKIPFKP